MVVKSTRYYLVVDSEYYGSMSFGNKDNAIKWAQKNCSNWKVIEVIKKTETDTVVIAGGNGPKHGKGLMANNHNKFD